jgi:beta-phosphoglucomutase family hydrolase
MSPPGRCGLPDGITACLFDLDGVLTRTASVHTAAWKQMFDDYLRARDGDGFAPFTEQDYREHVDGKPRQDGTRDFLRSRGIDLPEGSPDDPPEAETVVGLGRRKNDLLLERIARDGVETYDGSVAYLRAVRAAGLRTAVVSSSANTLAVLQATGIEELFDARIDAQVAHERGLQGKPAPDTFLAGAAALGVEPGQAAVFEDALAGVAAGHAGHFGYVVGVDRTGSAAGLAACGADVVVPDLAVLLDAS